MIKNDKSLLKYIFLIGLSDESIEEILKNKNKNISFNCLPKILSYYSYEGLNSLFKSIQENFETNFDLMNNIFPMKSDYLDIITNGDFDEIEIRKIKNTFDDYIIEINNNENIPEHIYHCFQYEFDKEDFQDLILNFGVLIFYENIIKKNINEIINKDNNTTNNTNIYSAKALILISEKPIFSLMKQTLEKIYSDFICQKFTPIHLENFIIDYINSLNTNFPSIKFNNGISINYKEIQDKILPFCDLNISYFFQIFDINDIYLISEYYFLTKSIIISSPNLEILYPIYHILMVLFFPLNFHFRSYFYKLLYPELFVEVLCGMIPCFCFIYTDVNKNDGFINENIIKRIAKEKEDILIYQIIKNNIGDNNKFNIKKNIYSFDKDKEIFNEINVENKKGKTLMENIIGDNLVYKSLINSEYSRIKKLRMNNSDFFDIDIDLKEYDLLRKNFLGMIIKFLVIEIKPLTFKLSEENKMEMCPLALENEKNEIDEQYKDFLDSPQTEIIYKNSTIKLNNLDIDYLRFQMLIDNFIKISKSDPNTLYFDEDNINNKDNDNNSEKINKNINSKYINFDEFFNYKKYMNDNLEEISDNKNILTFEQLNKYILYNKEKNEKNFGNKIKKVLFFNDDFNLNFDKYNKKILNESNNISTNNDKKNLFININDIISKNNKENLLFYYLILYEAQTFKKLFYTINTKNKKELSACYIGLYISLYILNLLTQITKESLEEQNDDNVIISIINTLFEKLFTLFTKTKCFYGKYNFITTLIYFILSSFVPLKMEYKERFIYSLQELKDVPSIIIFLLYNNNIEFNLCSINNTKSSFKEKKILYLKEKKHEHKFELEKISSNFVCVNNQCQEYMWFDLVNNDKDEKICENALNPIFKIEEILEKIKNKNSLILDCIDKWDYIYQVCILDEIYFNIRFFRDEYLDEIEY